MEENNELMETVETEDQDIYEWDEVETEEEEDGSVALGAAILIGVGTLLGAGGSWAYRKLKPKVQNKINKHKAKKSKKSKKSKVIDIEAVEVDEDEEE